MHLKSSAKSQQFPCFDYRNERFYVWEEKKCKQIGSTFKLCIPFATLRHTQDDKCIVSSQTLSTYHLPHFVILSIPHFVILSVAKDLVTTTSYPEQTTLVILSIPYFVILSAAKDLPRLDKAPSQHSKFLIPQRLPCHQNGLHAIL